MSTLQPMNNPLGHVPWCTIMNEFLGLINLTFPPNYEILLRFEYDNEDEDNSLNIISDKRRFLKYEFNL